MTTMAKVMGLGMLILGLAGCASQMDDTTMMKDEAPAMEKMADTMDKPMVPMEKGTMSSEMEAGTMQSAKPMQ